MKNKLYILSFFIIILFSILAFFNSSNENNDSVVPSIYEEKPEAPLLVSGKIKNESSNIANNKTDFDKVMEISSNYNTCQDEKNTTLSAKKSIETSLIDEVRDKLNFNDASISLAYLVNKGLISYNHATKVYEDKLDSFFFGELKTLNFESLNETSNEIISLKRNYELIELIKNGNELKDWFESKPNEKDEFFINTNGEEILISPNVIIGKNYSYISDENKETVFKYLKVNALMIKSAIESDVSLDLIMEMVEQSANINQVLRMPDGKITDLLYIAMKHDRKDVLSLLLNTNEFKKAAFLSSPVNMYLRDLIVEDNIEDLEPEFLSLLDKWDYFVNLTYSGNKKPSLHGYNGLKIPSRMVNKLKELNIRNINVDSIKEPNLSSLSKKTSLWLVDNTSQIRELNEQYQHIKEECGALKSELLNLEPSFSPLSDYQSLLDNKLTIKQNLKKLSAISPALADNYTLQLISSVDNKSKENIDTFLESVSDLNIIIKEGNKFLAHQQNYLGEKIFKLYGLYALQQVIEQGWYLDILHWDAMDKELKSDYIENYNNQEATTPSRLFNLLYSRDYKKAISLIELEPRLNGFPYGRDCLGLMLDRFIAFRAAPPSQEERILIEYLIDKTRLENYHLKRLHRLKLKLPGYFKNLENTFSKLGVVEDYPFSKYLGW